MSNKIAYRNTRTGRVAYVDPEHPQVPKMDAGKRWERVEQQPAAKATPAPRRDST